MLGDNVELYDTMIQDIQEQNGDVLVIFPAVAIYTDTIAYTQRLVVNLQKGHLFGVKPRFPLAVSQCNIKVNNITRTDHIPLNFEVNSGVNISFMADDGSSVKLCAEGLKLVFLGDKSIFRESI